MDYCLDFYLLSAIACQLSECLCKEELDILSSSLRSLGEMLELGAAQKARAGRCRECQKADKD